MVYRYVNMKHEHIEHIMFYLHTINQICFK